MPVTNHEKPMHMANRRKLGLAIAGTSAAAAIIIQLLTGRLVRAQTVREDKFQSGPDYVVASETDIHFNPRLALPLAACFSLGLACLVWPSRRPPRLAS